MEELIKKMNYASQESLGWLLAYSKSDNITEKNAFLNHAINKASEFEFLQKELNKLGK